MEIKAIFATNPKNVNVFVDPWMVDVTVETMFEMGAIAVSVSDE